MIILASCVFKFVQDIKSAHLAAIKFFELISSYCSNSNNCQAKGLARKILEKRVLLCNGMVVDDRFNQDKQLGQNVLLIYSVYTDTADVVDNKPNMEDVSDSLKKESERDVKR